MARGGRRARGARAVRGRRCALADGQAIRISPPGTRRTRSAPTRTGNGPAWTRCGGGWRARRLPRISAAVDYDNLVSVTHGVPRARSTWTRWRGTSRSGSRRATRISPRSASRTSPSTRGRARYLHGRESVLTRHWNHRDADRTKVTAAVSTSCSCSTRPPPRTSARGGRRRHRPRRAGLETRSQSVTTHWLTPATRGSSLGRGRRENGAAAHRPTRAGLVGHCPKRRDRHCVRGGAGDAEAAGAGSRRPARRRAR